MRVYPQSGAPPPARLSGCPAGPVGEALTHFVPFVHLLASPAVAIIRRMSSTRPKAPASAQQRSLSAQRAPAPFIVSEYVRWGDIDLAGIICYGAYLRVCELAETEIFRAAGLPFSEMFDRYDIWLPRKVIHAEFESPALLDEQLRVVTYFSHIGTTSLKINYDMMNADATALHAATHQVLVCVSRKGFKKMPLPDGVKLALARFALDSDAARADARRVYASSASSA